MKKSIFKASFEESLDLLDDGFLQYQKKDYYNKLGKAFKKGKPSFWFGIKTFILSLLFPIGANFMLLAVTLSLQNSDPKDLRLPVSQYPLLTVELYLICLLIWLLLVLMGKFFKRTFILPYRYRFHIITFIIWFVFEFNLLATTMSLPILSIWGILVLFWLQVLLTFVMLRTEVRSLKKRMYGEVKSPTLLDKIAKGLAIYGAGILGLAVIVNYIFKAFSINFSSSVTLLGLFIFWILSNIGVIAMIVFMEFPFFLEGYYKWKYPEEYRDWEGKTVEEWYGKKYLKKHKELLE
ncbi:putative membrane protein [Streptococcus mitis]|uniref:Membrane protein n=3 Tax=Streptococcus TaxID=1301 RepID=S7YYW2_STRMT|nr:membrane protein [Streptococcus mitis 29/42]KER08028.1 putative membrane protein [Streptococcus mitis]